MLPVSTAASCAGQLPSSPVAYLPHLPTKRVLTVNMDVPEAWLLEPALSPHDLDNLRCGVCERAGGRKVWDGLDGVHHVVALRRVADALLLSS